MRQLAEHGWNLALFSLAVDLPTTDVYQESLRGICETVMFEPIHIPKMIRYARVLRDVARSTAFQRDYFWSESAADRLHQWVRSTEFDLIFVNQLFMYRYLPSELRRTAVLDTHNAELLRLRSMSKGGGLTPRGIVARLQDGGVQRFEENAVRSMAHTLAVSPEEHRYFDGLVPGRVSLVPNGVDLTRYVERTSLPREPRILFIGSLSYSANVDAVQHLVRDILPKVSRLDTQVTVVGADPPRRLYDTVQRSPVPVAVTGYVESTRPYVEGNRLLVVPLRFGGGTRLKILEALAQGLPVISTSIGCAGLGLTHGQDVIVADDPTDFARWIDRLLEDDELCLSLGRAGRRKVEREYDWTRIGSNLHGILSALRRGG